MQQHSSRYFARKTYCINQGSSIQSLLLWFDDGQVRFAVALETSIRRWTEIKNERWETLHMIKNHSAIAVWKNHIVANRRDTDIRHTCLIGLEEDQGKQINMKSNGGYESFHTSDHGSQENDPLACHWTRTHGAERCCLWGDNVCIFRSTEVRSGLQHAIIITSPDGTSLDHIYHKASAMGVVDNRLWFVESLDKIIVWHKSNFGYGRYLSIRIRHSVLIVSICEYKEWAVLGTNGGFILLYDKVTGQQPQTGWGIQVGHGPVSLTTWRGKLVTCSGDTISFYNDKMQLEDSLQERGVDFMQMVILDSGMLYAVTKYEFYVYAEKLDWGIQRLLWIAFFKNRSNKKCHLARLPRELIRLVASMIKIGEQQSTPNPEHTTKRTSILETLFKGLFY